MTLSQEIITIGMVVLGTALTRYLPFLLFPAGKPTPKYIQYLGKVLELLLPDICLFFCFRQENLRLSIYSIWEKYSPGPYLAFW